MVGGTQQGFVQQQTLSSATSAEEEQTEKAKGPKLREKTHWMIEWAADHFAEVSDDTVLSLILFYSFNIESYF